MIHPIGAKMIKYINDELHIFRIINTDTETITLLDLTTNKSNVYTREEIEKDEDKYSYIYIKPDAFLNIFAVDIDTYLDMYVAINKAGSKQPNIISRQVCISSMDNFNGRSNKIYVGECLTDVSNDRSEIINLCEFRSIDKTWMVCMYIDDTIDDIINCIPKDKMKEINHYFKEIKKDMQKPNTVGYCNSLKEFMEYHYIMKKFHEIFNIHNIDWRIELDNNSSEDGIITLNKKQQDLLEQYVEKHITDIIVIKYDKDINISKEITKSHIVVCDPSNNIYLIVFNIIGDYISIK